MSTFRQEMPPKGGYGPIEYLARTPPKGLSGLQWIGCFAAVTASGLIGYHFINKRNWRRYIEYNDCRVAIEPFILAERNRMLLRHYRQARDEENKIMAGVDGWVTGTLYGEPIYHNPNKRFPPHDFNELFVHQSKWDLTKRFYYKTQF